MGNNKVSKSFALIQSKKANVILNISKSPPWYVYCKTLELKENGAC